MEFKSLKCRISYIYTDIFSEEVELDNSGVIEGEELIDLPMGDEELIPSDDDVEKANSIRFVFI